MVTEHKSWANTEAVQDLECAGRWDDALEHVPEQTLFAMGDCLCIFSHSAFLFRGALQCQSLPNICKDYKKHPHCFSESEAFSLLSFT